MASRATITVIQEDKTRFDRHSDLAGGLPHVRMFKALLNAWERLNVAEQVHAIRSTADVADDADQPDVEPVADA
jgi:hypothetical protein